MSSIKKVVDKAYDGRKIREYLKEELGLSSRLIRSASVDKRIFVNNKAVKMNYILNANDNILIDLMKDETQNIDPENIPIELVYEDEDILVINKAADMPVHPSIGNYDNTLANGVTWYFKEKGQHFVYRCINRLDRDTTGALILAKNPYSAAVLSAQMKQRQIRRTYLAIVQGIAPEQGTIDAPIGRAADSTIERQVDFANGESAVTHYERLATYHSYSLIELHLETGRTHQIRVHMKYIGHPLPGDFLYNPDYRIIKRQPLHSFQLEFAHPVTRENMCMTAPVPEDFADAFHRS